MRVKQIVMKRWFRWPVLAAAREAIRDGDIYYTSALGIPELREAIARHYHDHFGVSVGPERVIVTAGSSRCRLHHSTSAGCS